MNATTAPNAAAWIAAQTRRGTPVVSGPPGTGKSELALAFTQSLRKATSEPWRFYCLQLSLLGQGEINGFPFLVDLPEPVQVRGHDGEKHEVTKCSANMPMRWLIEAAKGYLVLLVDELTTCGPSVQAEALQLLAHGRVGDYTLDRDRLIILGACNPPEMAANGMPFEPPMANRLMHLDWQTPKEAILEGYAAGCEYETPSFPILPADWKKHVPEVGGIVSAFHNYSPGRLLQFPNERAKRSGPWPSPRTWDYLIHQVAAARAVNAPKALQLTLASACVGDAAAAEFFTYWDNLDLPDPEKVIAQAVNALKAGQKRGENPEIEDYQHPDRPDKTLAMLAGVSNAILQNPTSERWEAGMLIVQHAARREMDVALAAARPLAREIHRFPGARFPGEFVAKLFPKMQRAWEGLA